MANSIVQGKSFDISKVTFGQLKALENGGKLIPVYYDGNPFIIQTPKMKSPFGASRWENTDRGAAVKVSIDLSFGDYAESKDLTAFYNMINELNTFFVSQAIDNSNAWFKKKYNSVEVVEALYTSLIRHSKEGQYPPTFKISLPMRNDVNTFKTYNANMEKIEFDTVDIKGGEVQAIVRCNGIWIVGGKFGCTWKTEQIKVVPNPRHMPPFAFKEDPETAYTVAGQ